jgi:hypothetical protein
MKKKSVTRYFQFWCINSGVTDLEHLTRYNLPAKYGKDFHMALVKQYHSILLANGIKEYSLEECIYDYRMKVAEMILMPVWYYSLGITYDNWYDELKLLISNYNCLNCFELIGL